MIENPVLYEKLLLIQNMYLLYLL